MSWIKCAAIPIGGAVGAFFAILSIGIFDSGDSQLGFVAACTIFGIIVCAAISDGFPQLERKSSQSELSKPLEVDEPPQRQSVPPVNAPQLSPE